MTLLYSITIVCIKILRVIKEQEYIKKNIRKIPFNVEPKNCIIKKIVSTFPSVFLNEKFSFLNVHVC